METKIGGQQSTGVLVAYCSICGQFQPVLHVGLRFGEQLFVCHACVQEMDRALTEEAEQYAAYKPAA